MYLGREIADFDESSSKGSGPPANSISHLGFDPQPQGEPSRIHVGC